MPVFPPAATPNEASNFTVSLVDVSGEIGKASLAGDGLVAASEGQRDAWVTAIGNASNAAVFATNLTVEESVSRGNVFPFDEGHSSSRTKAIFVFQDNQKRIKRLEVPAPDLTLFGSDGKSLNRDNALVTAIINTTLAVLNAGDPAGTFAYIRGGYGSRERGSTLTNDAPTAAEPLALQNPPIAPA
jgi:hypothetical protein